MAAAAAAAEEQRECARHAEAFFLWMVRSTRTILSASTRIASRDSLFCISLRPCREETPHLRLMVSILYKTTCILHLVLSAVVSAFAQESVLEEHLVARSPALSGQAQSAGRLAAVETAAQHVAAVAGAGEVCGRRTL